MLAQQIQVDFPFSIIDKSQLFHSKSFVSLYTNSSLQNIYDLSHFYPLPVSILCCCCCSLCVFILKCNHPLSDSLYCSECIYFNHSGIFIYSNYIPKCNWFPVLFIYSELEIFFKIQILWYIFTFLFFFFLIHQGPEIQLNNWSRSWIAPMC